MCALSAVCVCVCELNDECVNRIGSELNMPHLGHIVGGENDFLSRGFMGR